MRRHFRLLLVVASTIAVLAFPCILTAAPFAYIGNDQKKLFVVDTATESIIATLPLTDSVSGIAVSPDGRRVYAANSRRVFVIDASTHRVLADIPTGTAPYGLTGIAVNPAGTRVYATSNWDQSVVKIVDTASNSIVRSIDFGYGSRPLGIAVHPNGRRIYVVLAERGTLAVVDATTDTVVNHIPLSGACSHPVSSPWGVAVDPAGRRVYVADQNCSDAQGRAYIYVIDAGSETVIANVATVETGARGIAVGPDGTRIYVSNGAVVDAHSLTIVGKTSSSFIGVATHPDGAHLYVHAGGHVGVVDTRTLKTTRWIEVGGITYVFGQFVGPSPAVPSSLAPVVEYYHAAFDHYFITWRPGEIGKLDEGVEIKGWARTGLSFRTSVSPQEGTSPVCRYYIPPALGDSHFFGRGTVECDDTGRANPSFVLEDASFMHMRLRLPVAGVCPAETSPVYRVFSNRADANHRYTTDPAVRDKMVARGWLAEGDGPDLVVMCGPR